MSFHKLITNCFLKPAFLVLVIFLSQFSIAEEQRTGSLVTSEIGILVVYAAEDSSQSVMVQDFLKALGRFWSERYGRVKPTPYPLASYNLSQPAVRERLQQVFPGLDQVVPSARLCTFSQGKPTDFLGPAVTLESPDSAVRKLSSRRRQALILNSR